MGLVHYVLPDDRLVSFTEEMAQEISGNAPLSLKGMKTIFNALLRYKKLDPEDMQVIQKIAAQFFISEDLKEGQNAFLGKRKPIFKGK